jgi:phytoene dehydrogenase-like protein
MRVLVVGAGLAGLTAASRLQGHDADVTVFEARHRVGGRVWSHRFENGAVVELGGEWIDSSHTAVTGLAEELGLRLIDTKQDFITRDLIGSDPIDAGDHARLSERLLESIEGIARADLESMSVADLLERISHSGPAMTVLRSRLEGTFGVSLSRGLRPSWARSSAWSRPPHTFGWKEATIGSPRVWPPVSTYG